MGFKKGETPEDWKVAENFANKLAEAIDKPSVFGELFFDHESFDYNKRFLDCDERYIVYRAGSKVGKSTSTAIKALHAAFLADIIHPMVKNKCEIIIVAPTQAQANIILGVIKTFLNTSKLLKDYVVRDTAYQVDVAFLSGNGMSSIYTRAAGERGDSLRGYIPHYIIFDEAAFIKDDIFNAIIPRGVATKARVWMISTPFGKRGIFYHTCMDARSGQPDKYEPANPTGQFIEFRARTQDNPYVRDDPSYLQIIKSYTRDQYIQEVEGEFLEEGDNLIPLTMIRDSFKDYTLPHIPRYFLGVDVARSGIDDTVYTIVATDDDREVVYVEYIEAEQKRGDLVEIVKHTEQLASAYRVETIFVDETGLGSGVVDMCRSRELPVRGIVFSLQEKEILYKNLRLLFENKRIFLKPTDQCKKLAYQLQELRKEYTEGSGTMKVLSDVHDDYPASLSLACRAVDKGGEFGLLEGLPF